MKLKKILQSLLVENDSEMIQMYLDIISDNPTNPKYDKYKDILLSKYGVDWKKEINDDDHLNNIDLNNIKDKKDFRNWDTYVKYAKEVFYLRQLNEPNIDTSKDIPLDYVKNILSKLGLKVEQRQQTGSGNYAQHTSSKIEIPDPCDIKTLIHEIGHEFDEKIYKDGIAKKNTYASSSYGINNGGEVIAENFMHYFLASSWLKSVLPDVYKDLNSQIPTNWKSAIKLLMNY